MIISHKYQFIFIKPTKVAGTSIEVAISPHLGIDDIATKIFDTDGVLSSRDKNQNSENFYNHILPELIKQRISVQDWDNYYKFTVVRNPWDRMVSLYFFKKNNYHIKLKKILSHKFNFKCLILFIKYLLLITVYLNFTVFICMFRFLGNVHSKNLNYYFDAEKNPYCDFFIRYEFLEEDYKKVCEKIRIPYQKLPYTKTKQRKNKTNYKSYYNNLTRKIVAKMYEHDIQYFNYKF